MFHLYLTLAYIIPNIYVFFRVKSLFISKAYRKWYILVYLLIAAIYPLAQSFSHEKMNGAMLLFSAIANYILPFFLYFFLSVVLIDLFLLLNRWVGLLNQETLKRFSFRFYTLLTIIVLAIMVVIGGVINLNTIRVSEYSISVPKKNSKRKHLRVAFVADMHIQQNTRLHFIEQFVSKVNAMHLDLMLFGGDIVEGDSDKETNEAIEKVLRTINAKYGSYGVIGNHEFYGGMKLDAFFQNAGIKLLFDTLVNIDDSFYLAGRLDAHFKRRKDLKTILGSKPLDLPILLLDHRPNELQELSKSGAAVQFSGHTHNGQLFPFNLIMRSIYELPWGYKKIANTHFFVTSGLRLWGPPVKTAGKSEIMLVDIAFE